MTEAAEKKRSGWGEVRGRRRAVGSISKTFDSLRNDYDAAKSNRFRQTISGVPTLGGGADYHYRNESDYYRIGELANHFDRNDMVTGQAVTRFLNLTLKQGFRCDPDTGSDELDTALVERWQEWSSDPAQCDVAMEHRLHKIARLAARARIFAGDHFVLLAQGGALQSVEGYRCKTPTRTKQNVVLGIKLDPLTRRRDEYWFTKDDISPTRSVQFLRDVDTYPARDANGNRHVLHIYDPKRVTQTRGVSTVAPIFDPIAMHNDIHFAELVRRQVSACIAIFRNINPDVASGDWEQLGARVEEAMADGGTRIIEDLAPGLEIQGRPGEKLEGFTPNIPGSEFKPHMMLVLSIIAVNLDIPVQVLLLDPSMTNFSGWRGAWDMAKVGFRRFQMDMIEQFYSPVFAWKVRQWAISDPVIAPLAKDIDPKLLFRHSFIPPSWEYLDPLKDAQADSQIISEGLDARRAVLGRRGLNIEEVDKDIVNDNERLIRFAIVSATRIKEKYKDSDVTWRDLLCPFPRETVPLGQPEPQLPQQGSANE